MPRVRRPERHISMYDSAAAVPAVLFYRASEWSYLNRVNVYYPPRATLLKTGGAPSPSTPVRDRILAGCCKIRRRLF